MTDPKLSKVIEMLQASDEEIANSTIAELSSQVEMLSEVLREIDRDCMDWTRVESVSLGERRALLALVGKIRAALAKL